MATVIFPLHLPRQAAMELNPKDSARQTAAAVTRATTTQNQPSQAQTIRGKLVVFCPFRLCIVTTGTTPLSPGLMGQEPETATVSAKTRMDAEHVASTAAGQRTTLSPAQAKPPHGHV